MILSKTVILVGGWAFVRKYRSQWSKDPASLSRNRSSFFTRHKHSTPPFRWKNM